jgi:branched-chain amino acid aminotransferase
MHRFLLHNEEIVDAASRTMGAGQVGLLTGWGVFSTMRVYDGVIFAWERHWQRLQTDAGRMRVPFPAEPGPILERLHRLIDANQAYNSTMRLSIIRNRGGMFEGPGNSRDFDIIGFTRDVNNWGPSVKLGVVPNARLAASEFSGVKVLSWSENLAWYERAHAQGLDEVILLNERGEVAECTSANVFAVRGNRVWTPPLSAGCLPGVTRAIVLEEIRVPGIELSERTLLPGDLEQADEVFITSTTRELLPVASIEGVKRYESHSKRDIFQKAFTEIVQSYVAAHRRSAEPVGKAPAIA